MKKSWAATSKSGERRDVRPILCRTCMGFLDLARMNTRARKDRKPTIAMPVGCFVREDFESLFAAGLITLEGNTPFITAAGHDLLPMGVL